jgi:hypothetical protein
VILLVQAYVVPRASFRVPPDTEGRAACVAFVIVIVIGISVSNRYVQVSKKQYLSLLNVVAALRARRKRASALEQGMPYFAY